MTDHRFAVKSFIVKKGKLLLVKRSPTDRYMPGAWELPGGKLDDEEHPIDGLKRETKEETNLDIEVFDPFSVRHFSTPNHEAITLIVYFCMALSDDIKLSHEHTEYCWVPLKDAKSKITEFYGKEIDLFCKLGLDKLF